MGTTSGKAEELNISRERMIELLNEDLAREYQPSSLTSSTAKC